MMQNNRRTLDIPQDIDNLIVSESIVRGISIRSVVVEKLTDAYTNNSPIHNKLNYIIEQLNNRKKNKTQRAFNLEDYRDKPKVPIQEIKASRKKYVKNHTKNDEPIAPIRDVFSQFNK